MNYSQLNIQNLKLKYASIVKSLQVNKIEK